MQILIFLPKTIQISEKCTNQVDPETDLYNLVMSFKIIRPGEKLNIVYSKQKITILWCPDILSVRAWWQSAFPQIGSWSTWCPEAAGRSWAATWSSWSGSSRSPSTCCPTATPRCSTERWERRRIEGRGRLLRCIRGKEESVFEVSWEMAATFVRTVRDDIVWWSSPSRRWMRRLATRLRAAFLPEEKKLKMIYFLK